MEDKIELPIELLEEIKKIITLQKPYLDLLEDNFAFIKYRNISRISEIESLLDKIFSMIQTSETLDLYTRVC